MLISAYTADKIEAGCDEAGRGCLAGPVFAASVILPKNYTNSKLNDSKQVTEKVRYQLRETIQNEAIAWAVASVSNDEIDEINILNASFFAMHRAIDQLKIRPELLLIDGNRFNKYQSLPYQCIIKGDGKFLSVAAASILAKTYRDDFMKNCHSLFPQYYWNKNKGYPTFAHRLAIYEFGTSPLHRKSFNCHFQMKIDF